MRTEAPVKMLSVLLIEDDEEDAYIARRAFTEGRIANPLHVVRTGEEALDYLGQRGRYAEPGAGPRPGLILLDLNLPGLSGRELLKHVKTEPSLRRIPVVVLTTSSEEADVLGCYDCGANTYITKPVEFERFLSAVRAIGQYWLCIAEIPCQYEVGSQ
ncbi:MAG: response regulator [Planctomycetota bacterium]